MRGKRYVALVAVTAFLAGCDSAPQEAVPEATRENCTKEIIEGIKDKGAREEFAGKCLRLSAYKPSPEKAW